MSISICFYFPYYEDSGVPVLFSRMANAIALSNSNIQISIIDFENGSMWRNILDLPNIKKIKFETNHEVSPPQGSILVMQSLVPYYWPKELILLPKQKLFFWNLYPKNLVPSLLPLPYFRELVFTNFNFYRIISKCYPNLFRNLNEYVDVLVSNNGLSFMDKSNLEYTEKYLFKSFDDRQFLPVPADFIHKCKEVLPRRYLNNSIKFAWVGRLCDFKSHILIYAINNLNRIAPDFIGKEFIFHIVGDGSFESSIKKEVKKCTSIKLIFHGAMPHFQLDSFLGDMDIVMAMGTSALEGAKIGKPTILLDPTLKKVSGDYVFRMLHNTLEYDLGHFITKNDFVRNNTSLKDILVNIIENYDSVSKDSSAYFFANHHLERVKDLFINKVSSSSLTFSMLKADLFEKPWLLKVYNKFRGLKS